MFVTLQFKTTVLPGHRIEVKTPQLPEGKVATVFIQIEDESTPAKRPFKEVLGDYPGQQLFRSAKEVDDYIRAERDSWER